jgi:hypothetical protein
MLPDFRLVIASIATAVMVVTLGLGTIAAFRTGALSGLQPMAKQTEPSFADLGMRRQVPDPAPTRSDPGNDNGANSSANSPWTVFAGPDGSHVAAGARPPAVTDPVVTGALGPVTESKEGRRFSEQRLIVDAPNVIAGDPKSPSASATTLADQRREGAAAAVPSAATLETAVRNALSATVAAIVVPQKGASLQAGAPGNGASIEAQGQGTSIHEAADQDQSSELTVASVIQAHPRRHGAQTAARAVHPKWPIAGQKMRKTRLVHRFGPMNDNFVADDYVPIFGPERSFGPDQPFTNGSGQHRF